MVWRHRPNRRSTRPNPVVRSWAIGACLLSILLGTESATQSGGAVPARGPAGITWLILVDDLHMDYRNTGRIRDLLRSIATGLMGDDDAVVMRASGPSSISIGWTADRVTFAEATQ